MLPAIPDVAPGGWRLAAVPFAVAVPAVLLAPPLAAACVIAGLAIVWFHRDPARSPPPSGYVAPADGRVTQVHSEGNRVRVATFMTVRDVHVNRAPAPGTVHSVTHTPGAHRPAFSKASDRNERVTLDCRDYEVTLIAGAFARRIHPSVESGADLERGERIGHISFGSRADVLLPPEYDELDVRVSEGQRVRAGETVIVA